MSAQDDHEAHTRLVAYYMEMVITNLTSRMIEHDRSKTLTPEREINEAIPIRHDIRYGSKEYKDRLALIMPALEHHYRHNDHHPEHHPKGMSGMSLPSLVEMLCDWKASSLRQKEGSILRSIIIARQRHEISEQLYHILRNTAKELGWTE